MPIRKVELKENIEHRTENFEFRSSLFIIRYFLLENGARKTFDLRANKVVLW